MKVGLLRCQYCRCQGLGRESVVEHLPSSHKVLGCVPHSEEKKTGSVGKGRWCEKAATENLLSHSLHLPGLRVLSYYTVSSWGSLGDTTQCFPVSGSQVNMAWRF